MSEERKRPVWPWVAFLLIGLPVLYVASFGPACWAMDCTRQGHRVVAAVYRPLLWLAVSGPSALSIAIFRYARLYADDDWTVDPFSLDFVRFHPKFELPRGLLFVIEPF